METFTKSIPVSFRAIAAGDGYWGMVKGTIVVFKMCKIIATIDNDSSWAEVQLTHNTDATRDGLCYSDSGIQGTVRKKLAEYEEIASIINVSGVNGSEQGMQGQFMYSMDADIVPKIKKLEFIESGFEMLT